MLPRIIYTIVALAAAVMALPAADVVEARTPQCGKKDF
jgi:uncharacterized membrane protein YuzA (DUF378 family)